jgi:probable DNA metabolism protein
VRYSAVFEPHFNAWRSAVRPLLALQVEAQDIEWRPAGSTQSGLFAAPPPPATDRPLPSMPRAFFALARSGLAFDAPDRFSLPYAVARLVAERGGEVLHDIGIREVRELKRRAKAVHRDVHKMHAFVRFAKTTDDNGERWVSWHRPDHFIIRQATPHFEKRFGDMRFALLTPKGSAVFTPEDGVTYGPGVAHHIAPTEDDLDALWCTYYASIYNPARTLTDAMRSEMPMKHWGTMPETKLIPRLLAEAPRRLAEAAARNPDGASTVLPPQDAPLSAVHDAVRACRGCPLAGPATQAVPGEGPKTARIVIVGEQPGDNEDLAGRPFVGPAGQLLMEVLSAVGLAREQVYLTNAVKHFHHKRQGKIRLHQRPEALHTELCAPFLHAELARVQPTVVVALGATAARTLLGRAVKLESVYGRTLTARGGHTLIVGPHPAAILRRPDNPELGRQLHDVLLKATAMTAASA